MITLEQLQATGTKAQLTEWWTAAQADIDSNGPYAESARAAMQFRRHPDTIISGVLTKIQLADWIHKINAGEVKDMLLEHGLTVVSDRKAFFLTDDSLWGWDVLPKKMVAVTHRLPLGTAHKLFASVQDFCDHFYKGEQYLGSVEELIEYVNKHYGS